jgi:hypothetical protein
MNRFLSIALMGSIFLTGCVSTKPIQYPASGSNTTISVSSESSTYIKESVAGDYFINDSQIIVGDASNTSTNVASGMFGLIGVGVAISIDKKLNGSAISKSTIKQPIKFDQLVQQKINTALAANQTDSSLKLLVSDQLADIKIVPFARISFSEKPNVKVIYGLKAQLKNSADNNASAKRFYNYVSLSKMPLEQWDSNNNAAFMQTADKAFEALSQVLVMDIQHQLNLDTVSDSKQKTCVADRAIGDIYFIESPDHLCIAAVKFKNKTLTDRLLIIEQ